MQLNPETIDLDEAYCPQCGPEHNLKVEGCGQRENEAECMNCGWEGVCGDLMQFLESLDRDDD